MHHARGGHALLAAAGKLYAIGGNTAFTDVAPAEIYDPGSNAWSDLPSLPAPRNHVSGFVFGADVCVAGGRSPATGRVDCFNFESSSWVRLPDLPRATSGAGAATLDGGSAMILGGENAQETTISDQFARLPSPDGWSSVETMLVPRHGFELAAFQGRAWACGGGSLPGLHPVATCTSVL
jgi:N-acetylneuraminic acid mutarotase